VVVVYGGGYDGVRDNGRTRNLLPGAQTVTCERGELIWCVCCALSEERVMEVLNGKADG
jgi:hypothetical protein